MSKKKKMSAKQVIDEFTRDFELHDRNLYKVAYSPLTPSRVLMIGDSPGGDPCDPKTVANYKEVYEPGEHDFLDEKYELANETRKLFKKAFGRSGDAKLRDVQVTNASFFRSPKSPESKTTESNRRKCKPYLTRLIKIVNPSLILANGMAVYRYLKKSVKHGVEIDQAIYHSPKRRLVYYRRTQGTFELLDWNEIDLVGFHHLTGYRWRNQDLDDLANRIRRAWPR